MRRVVFDFELKRPGCVLLQAALGGDRAIANAFPAELWLVAPTDNMKVYDITDEQAAKLIRYGRTVKK